MSNNGDRIVEQPDPADVARTDGAVAQTHNPELAVPVVAPTHDPAPAAMDKPAAGLGEAASTEATTTDAAPVGAVNTDHAAAPTPDASPAVKKGSSPGKKFQRHPDDPLLYVETLTKGWAQGRTLTFMEGHLEGYRVARSQSYSRARDYTDTVTNEYFNFVPWRKGVLDPIPDGFNPQAVEHLSEIEEDQKAHKIEAMKSSIKAWLDRRIDGAKAAGRPGSKENDVWTRLLKQLSGVPSAKPKKLSAMQFWSKQHYTSLIKADCDSCWDAQKGRLGTNQRSQFREKVTTEYFHRLSEAEQLSWAEKAKQDHTREVAKWNAALSAPIDKSPEARQTAIDTVQTFLSPILDELHEATGFQVAVFLGGPEPRFGGRINVVAMHRGKNIAPSPQRWPAAQPQAHKIALRKFMDFVETCFTEDMKAQSALKKADQSSNPQESSSGSLMGTNEPGDQSKSSHEASGSSALPPSAAPHPNSVTPLPQSDAIPPRSALSQSGENARPPNASQRPANPPQDKSPRGASAVLASSPHIPPSIPKPKPAARKTAASKMPSQPISKSTARKAKRKDVVRSSVKEENEAIYTTSESESAVSTDEQISPPIKKVYNMRRRSIQADEEPSPSQNSDAHAKIQSDRGAAKSPKKTTATEKATKKGPISPTADNESAIVVDQRREQESEGAVIVNKDPRAGVEGTAKAPLSNLNLLINPPAWILHALEYLRLPDILLPIDRRKVDRGGSPTIGARQGWTLPNLYTQLLEEWLRLEQSADFASPQGPAGMLDSKERPREVHWWIARKRLFTVRPSIPDVDKFAGQWWKWWVRLQPEWREIAAPSGPSPSPLPRHGLDGDWSALDKPGINGFLSVVVCLKWWGSETATASNDPLWVTAVEDTKWVMNCIVRARSRRDEPVEKTGKERPAKRQRTV
ncbi:hypothetical protein CONPUDRAFT_156906 [Coniophora puteana RWD-64-598 SS2]|uniref:Uncharacterized protein n=1 Tax=Coniophora puteana (strain RWD-64-598) TaxID=741705 RepID=A0A5M3MEN0_CONPW|nr:uncharacterized protein CONPUDRAFT_156906 [Coniophora puteana RWD-64-598 SS2]EIW77719.1 hypothetical protein CONPUDRAFT_156906 [Coniophora puteana RWD-64-598 SS2]